MTDWSSKHWTNPVLGKADAGTYENIMRCFPNLQALPRGTTYHVYREFKPRTNTVEVTVYAKTPDRVQWRVDADITVETLERNEGVELMPEHFTITSWYRLDSKP